MTIISVDPGIAHFGLAVLERKNPTAPWVAVVAETISTSARVGLASRLEYIWRRVDELVQINVTAFDGIAMEAQARAQAGHQKRGTTNYDALAVREVVGMLRGMALCHGIPLVEVEPAAWKGCLGLKATADKKQVQRAVRALVRGCPQRMSEHASDAVGIGIGGARLIRER